MYNLLTFYILNKLPLCFTQKVTLVVLHNYTNSLQAAYIYIYIYTFYFLRTALHSGQNMSICEYINIILFYKNPRGEIRDFKS